MSIGWEPAINGHGKSQEFLQSNRFQETSRTPLYLTEAMQVTIWQAS